MAKFSELELEVAKYLRQPELCVVKKSFLVAEQAHANQVRASGEPYITHPVAVALILAKLRLDHQTIAAALLHDVLEDSEHTKESLSQNFDQKIEAEQYIKNHREPDQ